MGENGIEAVFMANRPTLQRFMRARIGDPQDAEDLLQELWIKLRGLNDGPIADPLAYLYRMADNLVLDRRRAAARRARRDEDWTKTQAGSAPDIDDRPSPEHVLLARERLRAIERALDALPERTARSFRLFRLEGRPQKLIAADMGLSVSAVEKHLQRAYRAVLQAQSEFDAGIGAPRRPLTTGGKGSYVGNG